MKVYSKVVTIALLLVSSFNFSLDIFQAIDQKNKKIIKQWLQSSPDVNVVNEHGQTVLMQTVIKGSNKRLVKKLLKKGVEINVVDAVGKSALDYVVEHNRSNVVLKLCKKGAKLAMQANEQKLKHLKRVARAKKAAVIIGSYAGWLLLTCPVWLAFTAWGNAHGCFLL